MRNIIIGLLLLLSVGASAQWQQTGSKVRYVNGLGIPTKDTAAGVSADSSQILIRPADSSLYVKYKRTWLRVGGGGGSIAGSGTTNYIPKFTSSSAIGNSQIFDNGTNVGIGTASPEALLHINKSIAGGEGGYIYIDNPANSTLNNKSGIKFGTSSGASFASVPTGEITNIVTNAGDGSSALTFGTFNGASSGERMRISANGNVGIGSYTTPAAKFVVDGTTLINTNTDNGVDKLQVSGSMNVSTLATTNNLSVTTNATVGGTATIVGDVQINGLIGVNTTPSSYAIKLQKSGNNIVEFGTQSATNYSRFVHSSSTPFGVIGNASGAGISGGSNGDFAIGTPSGSNNIIFHLNAVEKVRITSSGRILANTTTDNTVDQLQVNGSILSTQFKLSALNTAPATASSTGTLGEIRIDANYIYICTATNTWKRVAIATW